jgi:hypothetical protein
MMEQLDLPIKNKVNGITLKPLHASNLKNKSTFFLKDWWIHAFYNIEMGENC